MRMISAEILASQEFPGYVIGGLSVGEPHKEMYGMTDIAKPRYLMGVGITSNLLECISQVDMFDCVSNEKREMGFYILWKEK